MRLSPQIGWLALLAIAGTAAAADDSPGAWASGTLTGTLGDDDSRWLYSAELHARYSDLGSGINQWLARPAVGYAVSENARVWLGYSRYRNRSRTGNVTDENRYWQELDWKAAALGDSNVSFRVRLEQRDISVSRETQHVARLRVKYDRSLAGGPMRTLVLSAESYFDLNSTDWAGGAGLAQYRLYGGLEWRLGARSKLETGYLHQRVEVASQIDRANHIAMIAFKTSLR